MRGHRVAGVPQVVKVDAAETCLRQSGSPVLLEVAPADGVATRPRENKRQAHQRGQARDRLLGRAGRPPEMPARAQTGHSVS